MKYPHNRNQILFLVGWMMGLMGFQQKRFTSSESIPLIGSGRKDIRDSRALSIVGSGTSVDLPGEKRTEPRPIHADDFPYAYESSVWVYSSVWLIASNLSNLPIRITKKNRNGEEQEIKFSPLENPNPFMSREELIEATVSSMELQGNAYWELVKPEQFNGEISNLFWIMSNMVEVIPDRKKFLAGYKLKRNDKEVIYDVEGMAHFKYFHPSDYYYGLSPIRAAMVSIEIDGFGRRLFKQIYKNGAVPGGVLTSEEQLGEDVLRRLKKQWMDAYQTQDKAFSPAILEMGLKYDQIQLSPVDLQFLEIAKLSQREILAVFGVPPVLLGEQSANHATAREERRIFYENTLMPKAKKIADVIRMQVVSELGSDVEVRFDFSGIPELQEDLKETSEIIMNLKQSGIISANEARQMLSESMPLKTFSPFNGGDTI